VSLFGLTLDINDSVLSRQKANLRDACGTVGEGRLVGDHPAGADHDSDLGDHLAGADHDSGMADGHLVGDRLEDEGRDFGRADDHLAGDHPADADHDSGMVDGRLRDDRLVGAGHDSDTADDHLAGVGRDSGMDAHPAGLDRVAGLRVSRYQHHLVHTNCGIRPDWRRAHVAGVDRDFDMGGRLADDLPAGVDHGSGKADDHLEDDLPEDEGHGFGKVGGRLAGDHRLDAAYVDLRRGCRNYHRVDQRYTGVFRRRQDVHCLVAYECLDALHRRPWGH